MNPIVSDHIWSANSLFNKAKLYAQQMQNHTASDWQNYLWCALSLEFLERAALAHISPVLLADCKKWENIAYAIGRGKLSRLQVPRSISTGNVIKRLESLVPEFTTEHLNFCMDLAQKRNSELHSGDLAFTNLSESKWLARFYQVCKILLTSMDKGLGNFFSDPTIAIERIRALEEQVDASINRQISDAKHRWLEKDVQTRQQLTIKSREWATRQAGHRVKCPACDSCALIQGQSVGEIQESFVDDLIEQREEMLPSSFECIACELRISGLSKLTACGLGDSYTAKYTLTAVELFGPSIIDEVMRDEAYFEVDYNE